MKGYRYAAAFLSMFEVMIYVVGLSLVLQNLNEIQNLIAYAVGYGTGVIVGTKIEEKLALGYMTVHATTAQVDFSLETMLREHGYGVTSWVARGREGQRLVLKILTPRKREKALYKLIREFDPKAFIISYEPRTIYGGFWVKAIRSKQDIEENPEVYP